MEAAAVREAEVVASLDTAVGAVAAAAATEEPGACPSSSRSRSSELCLLHIFCHFAFLNQSWHLILQPSDSGSERGSSTRRSDGRSSPTNSIDSMTNSFDSLMADSRSLASCESIVWLPHAHTLMRVCVCVCMCVCVCVCVYFTVACFESISMHAQYILFLFLCTKIHSQYSVMCVVVQRGSASHNI